MGDRVDVSDLLTQVTRGGPATAVNQLMPLVYDQLHALAERRLREERVNHTLQPTALVHEAYLRMVDQRNVDWAGKTHFQAIASEMMFRVLCDHARNRGRDKRGGDWRRVTLSASDAADDGAAVDTSDLVEALESLSTRDPKQFEIARLRYLGGLTVPETAEHLGMPVRSVEREWEMAKAWLKRELARKEAS